MKISFSKEDTVYEINEKNPLDISIPLQFNGDQPNAYSVDRASSKPVKAGDLIGDTRQGGSINFQKYAFIPHCNGTHTECVGHITNERISVRDCLKDVFIPAILISVETENPRVSDDSYTSNLGKNDQMITRRSLSKIRTGSGRDLSVDEDTPFGLVIRTLPNNSEKLAQQYGDYIPPFFSNEAMEFIVELGVKHLLVDLPSIDRIFDDGILTNHRKFWNVGEGKFETNENSRTESTITELIYVPSEIKDGNYLLNLQIAAFESDASPSRPILFEFTQ